MRMINRWALVPAAVVLSAGLLAACSSTSSGSGSTAAGQASGSSSAGLSSAAKGTPVKVLDVGPDPSAPMDPTSGQAGVEAAVKAINAAGGIHGRPIQVTYCAGDNVALPVQTSINCINSALSSGVVFDVAMITGYPQLTPIQTAAGLGISGQTDVPPDFKGATWFPLVAGGIGNISGMAGLVEAAHVKKMCWVYIDVAGLGAEGQFAAQQVLAPRGLKLAGSVGLPPTASDLSPQAAAIKGCDGVTLVSTAQQDLQFIKAVRAMGNNVPITTAGVLSTATISQGLGQNAQNVYLASFVNHNSPGYQQYEKNLQAAGFANSQFDSDNAVMGWIGTEEFAAIAKSLKDISRASVLAAYKKQSHVTTAGLTPPLNFTKSQAGGGGAFPRVLNDTGVYYKYENGKLVFVGNAKNPFIPALLGSNTSLAIDSAPFSANG